MRFFTSALVFLLLLVFMAHLLSAVLQTPGSAVERKRQIAAREANTIDVLIVGNSHAYCTFNPDVMEQITSKRIFNAGMPDQKIDMLYYTLKEALKKQTPETIILEGFAFGRSDSSYKGYVANMDAMTPGWDKLRCSFEIFPDKFEALRMYTSLYRSHTNWKKPSILKKNIKYMLGMSDEYSKDFDGFYRLESLMSDVTIQKYKDAESIKFAPVVDEYTAGYFRRIASLCRERGIRLIVAVAPFNEIYRNKVNYSKFHDDLEALCQSEMAGFVDFNSLYDELGLTFDDFEDSFTHAQHMNVWGAGKVSTYMGAYLEE